MTMILRLAGASAIALALGTSGAFAQGDMGPGSGMMGGANSSAAGPAAPANAGDWGGGYGPGPWMMGNGYGPGPWMMQAGYWPRVGASGGWMGPWMMGWGGAYGPGPWMMHGGWMAPWSMGWGGEYGPAPGMMGGGWIDPWTVSWSGGCPGGWGPARPANFHLTVDQVKAGMGRWLSATGNPHVKLGAVAAKGSDTITADIVTTDNGGLVQRYEIDRRTGAIEPEGE